MKRYVFEVRVEVEAQSTAAAYDQVMTEVPNGKQYVLTNVYDDERQDDYITEATREPRD